MKTCRCETPVPHINPNYEGSCCKCGHKLKKKTPRKQHCSRCSHTLIEGCAVPYAGKTLILCEACEEDFRIFMRILPQGVHPSMVPELYQRA